MITSYIQCPKCRRLLVEEWIYNASTPMRCPGCGDALRIEVYPAFFRRTVALPEEVVSPAEGDSTCFYHASKKAVLPCDACGRFLCALCDCELNGQHLCPRCLEAGQSKGKIKNLDSSRKKWDSIALGLAVLPIATIVFWVFTIVTAPMALFIAIRYWNAPRSIFHQTKMRLVIAIVIAIMEILGWIALFYSLARLPNRG
jgi:ribosomal protein S27E